ncbi:MAG: hypothetical protein EBX39_13325 [Actinobacteria bacterium]|nr:hypothetical protein [Actinomycetota bacterium]
MAPGCKSLSASLLAALLSLALAATAAHAVTIDWVTVGDPGNAADTTGYGAVADSLQIMKYEWTNSQYVQFLNAVDPNGANPNSIYNNSMGSDPRGGISFTSGAGNGSKYAAKTNMGDKPVNFVSWWDAARVANWLQNGQGSGSTETGAYTLGNATSGTAPAKNAGAQLLQGERDQCRVLGIRNPGHRNGTDRRGGDGRGHRYFGRRQPGHQRQLRQLQL